MFDKLFSIHPLSPGRLKDYLRFFDQDAFSDNPHWAGCYCYFPFANHDEKPWEEREAAENRAAVSGLIQAERMQGYLAYFQDRVIGWCNAAPRSFYPNLPLEAGQPAQLTGMILCFVIAPGYRRQGVATRLLAAACDGLRNQGLTAAEAITRNNSDDPAANHHGYLNMYLAAGFIQVNNQGEFTIVRKQLRAPIEP